MSVATKDRLAAGLKRAMKAAEWNCAELSRRSGVHINTVIRAVDGEFDAKLDTALALATALGKTVEELIAEPKKKA